MKWTSLKLRIPHQVIILRMLKGKPQIEKQSQNPVRY